MTTEEDLDLPPMKGPRDEAIIVLGSITGWALGFGLALVIGWPWLTVVLSAAGILFGQWLTGEIILAVRVQARAAAMHAHFDARRAQLRAEERQQMERHRQEWAAQAKRHEEMRSNLRRNFLERG